MKAGMAATAREVLDAAWPERQLQEAVIAAARLHRWLYYHTYDARRSAPGFPDLVLVKDGRLLVAELKREHAEPTPVQQRWLDALGAVAGVEASCWRPSDWSSGAIERRLAAPSPDAPTAPPG